MAEHIMAFRPWAAEEEAFLRETHPTHTAAAQAAHLNRSTAAVRNKLRALRLRGDTLHRCRPWTAEEDNYLIAAYATQPLAAQAAHLGRSASSINMRKSALRRQGRLPKRQSVYNRLWSTDDDVHLIHLLQDGYSIQRIARKLKRTASAVQTRAGDLGGVRRLRNEILCVRTVHAVSQLFGVSFEMAKRWRRMGWLNVQRNAGAQGHGRYRQSLVTDTALLDFLQVREAWATWEPHWITDSDWRSEAAAVRAGQPRWLSYHEVAERLGLTYHQVKKRAARGDFPTRRIGIWTFVWEPDLEQRSAA